MFSAERKLRRSFAGDALAQLVSTFKTGVLTEFVVNKWLIFQGNDFDETHKRHQTY
jgi:hypothetical protein